MSWTLRGRRTAYDNIAVGSATGREVTITGTSLTTEEYGQLDRAGVATSWHTSTIQDNIVAGTEHTTAGENVDLTSGGTT